MNTPTMPNLLKKGDCAALVAPASGVSESVLRQAVFSLRYLGLSPKIYPSCVSQYGFLAGVDELRADDLNRAFADPGVQGIFCLRGGCGSLRILDRLDYDMIRKHPKVFCGYSDITALHTALRRKCGFVTFHAPMPSEGYYKIDDFSLNSLALSLFCGQNGKSRTFKNPPSCRLRAIAGGVAFGELTGGNLSLLAAALGTPYAIDAAGKILFLEEVNEPPYKIDRMLTSLRLSGVLCRATGVLLGSFRNCGEEKSASAADTLSLDRVFEDAFRPLGIPVLSGLAAGHTDPQLTLPLGRTFTMDADAGELTLMP